MAVLFIGIAQRNARSEITSISGVFEGQVVTVDVTFSNSPSFGGAWDFQLFIDTDKDLHTGYGAGYEYLVRDVGLAGVTAALYYAEPGAGPNGWGPLIGGVAAQMVSSGHLRLQIAVAANALPTGVIRYSFETYSNDELVDAVYDRSTTSTTGRDCNENGINDDRDIELGESDDCNGNGIPDECEPDCDGDGVPDVCAIEQCKPGQPWCGDCNGNLAPDNCDIIKGISDDCDFDDVPDECMGPTDDCNGNDVPDVCDIADGVSNDFNGNGAPDECELRAVGSRYLIVTPLGSDDPVALLVTGNPFDPKVSCVSQYVQTDGTLGVAPVFRFADDWGTVAVHDAEVQPATTYYVRYDTGDENFSVLSPPLVATTWWWGDTDHNYDVSFVDIARVVTGFGATFTPTLQREMVDLTGTGVGWCRPDGTVSFTDISACVDAFSTGTYPCASVCP